MIDTRIELPLPPMALPRHRVAFNPRTGKVHGYMPAKAHCWQADLATVAAARLPKRLIDEPVIAALLAVLPRPKYMLAKKYPDGLIWCDKRPDIDNLAKCCFDALRGFWRDDSLIVFSPAMKAYAERTGRPRTVLRISSIIGTPEQMAVRWGLL